MAIGGCIKQYDTFGYVSPNQAFMVLGRLAIVMMNPYLTVFAASGLQINACAKGEECIPQTWGMCLLLFTASYKLILIVDRHGIVSPIK